MTTCHQRKFPAFEQPHRIHSSAFATGLSVTIPSIGMAGTPITLGFIGKTCRKRSTNRYFSPYDRQIWIKRFPIEIASYSKAC
jgi:formate hydrogenlyase subunit 3/multisubunit Na+/H+ antiporter MnhD subunit